MAPKKDSSLPETDTAYLHEDTTTGRQNGPSAQLRILATQLGECCLATDLAALLSQRKNIDEKPNEETKSLRDDPKLLNKSFGGKEIRLETEDKSQRQAQETQKLTLSLFAKVVDSITLDKHIGSLFPFNVLFMYQSSQYFQNVCRESQIKATNNCECPWTPKKLIKHSIQQKNGQILSEYQSIERILHKYSLSVKNAQYNIDHKPLIANGIYYPKTSNREIIQKQIDPYFLKIVRTVIHGINSLNSVTSVSAITLVIQQLNVLSSYISAAKTNTIVKQVVDALMDTLLKLKVKLIDYSLNYSKSFSFKI